MKFADEFDMLPGAGIVLACVSGGADSMCLMEALLDISRARGFTVSAAHYNHGLRGDESDRDEEFVREQCAARDVFVYSEKGDVRSFSEKHGISLEEAARDMRYDFFYATASSIGAKRIATAHTADDNAETMIFNLTRGAGAAGLSGIPPKRGIVIRPMLRLSRDDVMLFINGRNIPFVEDSTNDLDVFTRNRLRHAVIPVLKEINPRFEESAASAAGLLRADDEYLSGLADIFITEHNAAPLEARELLALPFAVSSRVIRKLYGGNLSHKHVKTVLELCARGGPPASLSLPGKTVYVEYGRVVFGRAAASNEFDPVCPAIGECIEIPAIGLKITCKSVICGDRINKSFTSFLFKSADLCGKMTVRSRREGDTIRFIGQNGAKTLKKLFIERRVPARERLLIPVIADDAGVLAVCGFGTGCRAVPQPGDPAFQIDFEEI